MPDRIADEIRYYSSNPETIGENMLAGAHLKPLAIP